jgi:uncharacterized protein YcbX
VTSGDVAALWRFPVKSMRGESVDEIEVTPGGLVGDRAYALFDVETQKVVSAKTVRTFPSLLQCSARFVAPPTAGAEPPPVRIDLPDGSVVRSDEPDANAALSRFFGRQVQLTRSAPADFTIDQYHPDVEGADPRGYRDTVAEQKLGAALFAELGMAPAVDAGAFFDVFPVSVLTTATLDRLHELRPTSRFDARRFRMNVIVRTHETGFVENDWVGSSLTVGGSVRLGAAMPDPRCVMTTLAQDDLARDLDVLRTLAQHNRIDIGGGAYPCAGVYATVGAAGTIRAGDSVRVRPPRRT